MTNQHKETTINHIRSFGEGMGIISLPGEWVKGVALCDYRKQDCAENLFCGGQKEDVGERSLLGEAVFRVIYKQEEDLANMIARFVCAADMSSRIFEGVDFLTYIPKCGLHMRGYNGIRLLTERISKYSTIPHTTELLDKHGIIPELGSQRDPEHTTGKFTVLNPEKVLGRSLCLIGDIFDSGVSFIHAARALKQSGAGPITVLSITHFNRQEKRVTHL